MKFYFRGKFKDLWDMVCYDMYSCTMKSAESELQYIGIEVGRCGLVAIDGGRK
jgi:hypothetical protein